MEFLGSLLGNVASGGLFGLLGSVIGVVAKYIQEKQRQAWEREKWQHELRLLELQMKAKSAETEQELSVVSSAGAWDGLRASYEAPIAVRGVHRWVNDLRSLFRPFLTVFLWVAAVVVLWGVTTGWGSGWLGDAESRDLVRYAVQSLVFSASTATVWWFGDRALTPPGLKHR